MTSTVDVRRAGTSPAAIARHYDLSDEFFRGWLGDELVYSCALWRPQDPHDTLASAQQRKLDWFAERLRPDGGDVLDVGCGWGALLDRLAAAARHAVRRGTHAERQPGALTRARGRRARHDVPAAELGGPPTGRGRTTSSRRSSRPSTSPRTRCDSDDKVDVYREFFESAASWLRPGGRMGLQLICLDGVGEQASRLGQTAVGDLIGRDVFPESMPASLAEMVLGWETQFRLVAFLDSTPDYVRTFRAWALAHRRRRARGRRLVGTEVARRFDRYFAAGEVCFRLREHALYRVILTKRPQPKRWAVTVRPSDVPAHPRCAGRGASPGAVRAHYDLSERLLRGLARAHDDVHVGSVGRRGPARPGARPRPQERLLRRARRGRPGLPRARRRLRLGRHAATSPRAPRGGRRRRPHPQHGPAPVRPRSAGAGAGGAAGELDRPPADRSRTTRSRRSVPSSTSPGTGRRGRSGSRPTGRSSPGASSWLRDGGRLGLETIAHDDAPDTAAPRGTRTPRGQRPRALPRVRVPPPERDRAGLRALVRGGTPARDGGDFARTFRHWQLRLRAHEAAAAEATDPATVRRFRQYLAASEVQFRSGSSDQLPDRPAASSAAHTMTARPRPVRHPSTPVRGPFDARLRIRSDPLAAAS